MSLVLRCKDLNMDLDLRLMLWLEQERHSRLTQV